MAALSSRTNAPTACASWFGCVSTSFTMRLPTITASATAAILAALSASLMPKPTPIGSLMCWRSTAILAATSSVLSCAEPVTPLSET